MKLHLSIFRDFWKLILKQIDKNNDEKAQESIIRVRVG